MASNCSCPCRACLPRPLHKRPCIQCDTALWVVTTRSTEPELFCFSRRDPPSGGRLPVPSLFQLYYRNARFALAVNAKAEAAHIL